MKRILLPAVAGAFLGCWGAATPSQLGRVASAPSGLTRVGEATAEGVSVRSLGAVGDGVTDDGPALGAALATACRQHRLLVFPPGIYRVKTSLVVPSGCVLRGYGATLVSSSFDPYESVLTVDHASGVAIEGFEIDGRREDLGIATEFKHGVAILSSTDVTLRDLYVHDNMGDGVYVGASRDQTPSANVVASRIRSENNARQGMSITALDGGRFTGVVGRRSGGRAPQAGLDIEPNSEWEVVRNLEFVDCDFSGNAGAGIMVQFFPQPRAAQGGVVFRNCTSSANAFVGIRLVNPVSVTFENCTVADNVAWGVDWESGGRAVSFVRVVVRGNGGVGVGILPKPHQDVSDVSFTDTQILDNGRGGGGIGVNIDPGAGAHVRGVTFDRVKIAGSSHAYGLRTGGSRVSHVTIVRTSVSGARVEQSSLCDDEATRRVGESPGMESPAQHLCR